MILKNNLKLSKYISKNLTFCLWIKFWDIIVTDETNMWTYNL